MASALEALRLAEWSSSCMAGLWLVWAMGITIVLYGLYLVGEKRCERRDQKTDALERTYKEALEALGRETTERLSQLEVATA